jgi:2-octaprenyl-6-methoxyphenol hydroxylase
MMQNVDILVSGGGLAGMSAAAVFGGMGLRVLVVDPAPKSDEAWGPASDLRTTAILQPGADLLAAAGVWAQMLPHATPLRVMRIVDAGGPEPQARALRDFDSADLSGRPFGWNLPNAVILRELRAYLAGLPGVEYRPGTGTSGVLTRDAEARVTLTDGSRVSARLLVAADGRDSPVRRALDIPVTTLRYGQTALVFAVTHPIPHDNISTEVHRSGGPFTLVPLPDHGGRPASSVVWMERAAEAERLAGLPDAEFAALASERSAHVLGPLAPVTRRQAWPIIGQVAHRMAGQRVALVAEAAHVVPPIGAQGLNMSLADIGCLAALAEAGDLGGAAMLDAYHRRRHPDVLARVMGIDALNRASMEGAPVWRDLRGQGLRLLHDVAPVRRTLMRLGLGAGRSAAPSP